MCPSMRAPQTTIYLAPEVKEAIDARRGFMSRSEWIRRAVHEALTKEAGG
jgi:metal-responsive CopG/Arc/MetJ family transcriptional regulator